MLAGTLRGPAGPGTILGGTVHMYRMGVKQLWSQNSSQKALGADNLVAIMRFLHA